MYIYSKITLLVLLLTLFVQYKRYGIKALLHPSFSFLAVWILSVLSFELFLLLGADLLIIREEYLNELFIFISFTSVCFIFWGLKLHKKVRENTVKLRLFIPYNLFKYFSLAFFAGALINFISAGFNVAESRAVSVENTIDFYTQGGKYFIWQLVLGVIFALNIPFTIYSGWIIVKQYLIGKGRINLIYFLPLASTALNVIAGGGRAGIISAFSFFVLGLLLALFANKTDYKKILRPILVYGLVVFFFISLYSTYISKQRTKLSGYNRVSYFISLIEQKPLLKPMGGIFEYLVFHYQGYQWRRMDSFSPQLEYGQNTFAFITNFRVPIISQLLDKNLSLQNWFNLKSPDIIGETLYNLESKLPGASITATVYFILMKDFGFYGTLLITFIFVGFSQKLYENLFIKNNIGFISIIFFIVVFKLWLTTIFSHHLAGTWFNIYLYPILLVEIINLIYRRKHYHKLSTDKDLFFRNNNTLVKN